MLQAHYRGNIGRAIARGMGPVLKLRRALQARVVVDIIASIEAVEANPSGILDGPTLEFILFLPIT